MRSHAAGCVGPRQTFHQDGQFAAAVLESTRPHGAPKQGLDRRPKYETGRSPTSGLLGRSQSAGCTAMRGLRRRAWRAIFRGVFQPKQDRGARPFSGQNNALAPLLTASKASGEDRAALSGKRPSDRQNPPGPHAVAWCVTPPGGPFLTRSQAERASTALRRSHEGFRFLGIDTNGTTSTLPNAGTKHADSPACSQRQHHPPHPPIFVLDVCGARRGFIADGWPVHWPRLRRAAGRFRPGRRDPDAPRAPRVAHGRGCRRRQVPSPRRSARRVSTSGRSARRSPTQTVKVRAWLAPVGPRGLPGRLARRREWPLRPEYEIFRGVIRSPSFDLRARTLTFTAEADLRIIDAKVPPSSIDS